jgi:hypothetical protein
VEGVDPTPTYPGRVEQTGPEHDADTTAPQPVVPRHAHEAPPAHHHAAPPRAAHTPAHVAPARLGRGAVVGAVIGALVLAGGVTAAALTRDVASAPAVAGTPAPGASDSDPLPVPADATESAEPLLDAAADTLVLGDSLGLTVYPWLADLLPDRYVSYEAEVGRSTPGSESALESLGEVPDLVIVSSGTNDALAEDVESSARDILDELGPDRCVVWVDVVRPDGIGADDDEINAALDRAVGERPNVRVLRWTEMIDEHPEWMSPDGIHPNRNGAEARAQAFADAALACSPLDPDAPRADRQYLPASAFVGAISGTATLAPQSPGGSAAPPTSTPEDEGSEAPPDSVSPSASGSPSPSQTSGSSPSASQSPSRTASASPTSAPSTSSAPPPPPPPTTSAPPASPQASAS